MVLGTDTFFMYTPLAAAGLALFRASSKAVRFSRSAAGSNEARPMVAWMMPALSVRY